MVPKPSSLSVARSSGVGCPPVSTRPSAFCGLVKDNCAKSASARMASTEPSDAQAKRRNAVTPAKRMFFTITVHSNSCHSNRLPHTHSRPLR